MRAKNTYLIGYILGLFIRHRKYDPSSRAAIAVVLREYLGSEATSSLVQVLRSTLDARLSRIDRESTWKELGFPDGLYNVLNAGGTYGQSVS
jgi:hypothetical protein